MFTIKIKSRRIKLFIKKSNANERVRSGGGSTTPCLKQRQRNYRKKSRPWSNHPSNEEISAAYPSPFRRTGEKHGQK